MSREKRLGFIFVIYGMGLMFESIGVSIWGLFTGGSNALSYTTIFIKENLYYVVNYLPFIAYNFSIVLTIIVIIYINDLRGKFLDVHFSRFAIIFSIGSLLLVLTSFFKTNIIEEMFVSDFGLYGEDRVEMYQFGLTFSILDVITKAVGYLLLLFAWLQFPKFVLFSIKTKRCGYLMAGLTGISLFIMIVSILTIWFEFFLLRTGYWYSPFYFLPPILENIMYFAWALSVFFPSFAFSIGYFIIGEVL